MRPLAQLFANHEKDEETTDVRPSTEDLQPPDREMDKPSHEGLPHKPKEKSCQHGPLFKELPEHMQSMIRKIHMNLGHPNNEMLQHALRRGGWSEIHV